MRSASKHSCAALRRTSCMKVNGSVRFVPHRACFMYSRLFRLSQTAENQLISVIPVIEGTVDPADGSRGSSCLFRNFQIGSLFLQHGCNFVTLGERKKFVYSAQILKETVAIFFILKTQDGFKQLVNSGSLYFLVHDKPPPRHLIHTAEFYHTKVFK